MRTSFIRLFGAGTAALVLGLLLCGWPGGRADAQDIWKPKQKSTPTPTPTPNGHRKRPPKPPRQPPAPTRLQVQGQLRKFNEAEGKRKLVSSGDNFSSQDMLQFAIKVNQNGYLYVVRQSAPGGDGQLLFPSKFYNGGNSYVKEDQELVLPSSCPASEFSAPCWFRLSAPEEALTVIFSRNRIEELANQSPAVVPAQTLSKLLAASQQQLSRIDGVSVPGVQDDRYTFWVTNTNEKKNEEIIYTLTLKGSSRSASKE
jgi:hypothetical protein